MAHCREAFYHWKSLEVNFTTLSYSKIVLIKICYIINTKEYLPTILVRNSEHKTVNHESGDFEIW